MSEKLPLSIRLKREQIDQINAQIYALAMERQRIEGAYLQELATHLGSGEATLLDSHMECAESPTGTCIFEITVKTDDLACLFCNRPINR